MDHGYGPIDFKVEVAGNETGEINKGYDSLDPAGSGMGSNSILKVDKVQWMDGGSSAGVNVVVREVGGAVTHFNHTVTSVEPSQCMEFQAFGSSNAVKDTGLEYEVSGGGTVIGTLLVSYHIEPRQ